MSNEVRELRRQIEALQRQVIDARREACDEAAEVLMDFGCVNTADDLMSVYEQIKALGKRKRHIDFTITAMAYEASLRSGPDLVEILRRAGMPANGWAQPPGTLMPQVGAWYGSIHTAYDPLSDVFKFRWVDA